jgi:outer membrane receptor protein involved in Fe transport
VPYRSMALCALFVFLGAGPARATIFGDVRGIVHDPDHRPIAGAKVSIHNPSSTWVKTTESNAQGEFEFPGVPVGEYMVWVEAQGFRVAALALAVTSASSPIVHFMLEIEPLEQRAVVTGSPNEVQTEAGPTTTLVERAQIARTPGANRTNSLAAITDYVPGAVIAHDMLHLRGGHQVTWAVNGVPIPNTNIASNVGPQFHPQDVDVLEVETGGNSADFGERTYGVFNVVPRSGFEFTRQAEATATFGNFGQTDDHLSFGSHTDRFAYYASLNGNRSDAGLMTPTSEVVHDFESGLGGFTSLMFNATPDDQLRLVASVRGDHYQIPNSPKQKASGIRDLDLERDAFVNFSWVHTMGAGALLTVSPFYHRNRADYLGGPNDPLVFNDNRASVYAGEETDLSLVRGKNTAFASFEVYRQHDDTFVSLSSETLTGIRQRMTPAGNFESGIVQDRYQATPWLSLSGGFEASRDSGLVNETAYDPQAGVALRLPKLGWVLNGSYARTYQPPPLDTVSGPLAPFAVAQGFAFSPLYGERDEQRQFGLTVPLAGWTLYADTFYIKARNYFDHDALGNSNVFLPLTVRGARIYGWEASMRSPALFGKLKWRAAFSHQTAEGFGAVTGGLTDFSPPAQGYFFLDHDQRNTLSVVAEAELPHRAWAAATLAYGSGFLNGDGPAHLGAHTTFDLALGKSFREGWSVSLNALNVANRRYLVDNSNTFGGTHYVSPREIYGELAWRFNY